MPTTTLRDRVCVVIGAAHGGIGFAFAQEAAERYGMRVALCDRDEERLAARLHELKTSTTGGRHCCIPVDITSWEQVSQLGRRACELLGDDGEEDVAIIINCAAVFAEEPNPWTTTPQGLDDDNDSGGKLWDLAFRINVLGAVNVNRMALAVFSRTRPNQLLPHHLIQVSSLSAFTGGTGEPYASSKLALVSLMENLQRAKPTSNNNIHLHLVLPGVVNTQFAISSHRTKRAAALQLGNMNAVPANASQAVELREMMKLGLDPRQAARKMFDGVLARQFYILVDNDLPIDIEQVFARKARALLGGGGGEVPDYTAQVAVLVEAKRRAAALTSLI